MKGNKTHKRDRIKKHLDILIIFKKLSKWQMNSEIMIKKINKRIKIKKHQKIVK